MQQQPITILLVDDDPDFRALARAAIAHGYPSAQVWEVQGGRDALDFLLRRGARANAPMPDIVYTDLEMPDVSGQELLKAIKTNPNLERLPVVLLTGVSDESQRMEAQRNGAQFYALKPPRHNELRTTMIRTIQQILGVAPMAVAAAGVQP